MVMVLQKIMCAMVAKIWEKVKKQSTVKLWTSLKSAVVKPLFSHFISIIILSLYEMGYIVIMPFLGLFFWVKTIVDHRT